MPGRHRTHPGLVVCGRTTCLMESPISAGSNQRRSRGHSRVKGKSGGWRRRSTEWAKGAGHSRDGGCRESIGNSTCSTGVGCAGSYARVIRKFKARHSRACLMKQAGCDSRCSGARKPAPAIPARRSATILVATVDGAKRRDVIAQAARIVTHCPHCFQNLKK